tara:strand:+ start:36 stop:1133 length:1098 start_codon:yes stop_codon:yes gene_type:complete
MESIAQTFDGRADFGKKVSCTIGRNGDLVTRMYVEIEVEHVGGEDIVFDNALSYIKSVEVEIGGQLIDKHYGEWLHIWTSLTHCSDKTNQLQKLVKTGSGTTSRVYVPLQFWFCRNPGLALPLIALQYHEVKINIEFQDAKKLLANSGVSDSAFKMNNVCLFCDYIYLDTDERRRFAQISHEYLIEQVQFSGCNSVQAGGPSVQLVNIDLNLNHPVKELVWVVQSEYLNESTVGLIGSTDNHLHNFTNGMDASCHLNSAVLQLNGHDRFKKRSGSYFENVQRYQHHTGSSSDGIFMYSFALNPEEHQPSGTCNFSRIDNAVLCLELNTSKSPEDDSRVSRQVRIYAINYNVLRIMSGMAGLAYSN